jgi:hypothetical protein
MRTATLGPNEVRADPPKETSYGAPRLNPAPHRVQLAQQGWARRTHILLFLPMSKSGRNRSKVSQYLIRPGSFLLLPGIINLSCGSRFQGPRLQE